MKAGSKKARIGVIIDAIHEPYQSGIWKGICHRAQEWGADLLSFAGTSQDGVDHFDTHYDIIQHFATNSEIDAVIVFSGSISEHHGREFTTRLCESFNGLPLVCVSEKIEGFPAISVENGPGIDQIVAHLVSDHSREHIAFVKGPEGHAEAEARYQAYRNAIGRNGLRFDPALVFEGSFLARDGVRAVQSLIESGQPFDAIVCVNDHTALGAIDELARQRKHVPSAVSVAGFDDIAEAASTEPALTTVSQPLFLMGVSAVDNVLYQVTGKHVPEQTVLPTEPVFRRSCGCFSKEVITSTAAVAITGALSREEVTDRILQQVLPLMDTTGKHFPGESAFRKLLMDLIEALISNATHPKPRHAFLIGLDRLRFSAATWCNSLKLLKVLLRELTVCTPALFTEKAQLAEAANLLQQGNTLIQELRVKNERKGMISQKRFQRHINVVSQRIISSFEQRELLESIAKGLPTLNVDTLVLAVFQKDSIDRTKWEYSEFCELKLAYNQRKEKTLYPRDNFRIPSREIFVKDMIEENREQNHIFMPLVHRDEYLGYVVLAYTDTAPLFMYEELRQHIGSAVKSSMMLRKFKTQSLLDELTGVYNRRGFVNIGNKMLASAQTANLKLMMFYADVDGLKKINDTYGHEHGDRIISAAADVLSETFRERDLIARIGGDEFVVILLSDNMKGLENKIRKRFEAIEDKFNKKLNQEYRLSVSLGAAICRMSEEESLEKLMKRADTDLFAKKRARRLSLQQP